jgi:hypothetical protein
VTNGLIAPSGRDRLPDGFFFLREENPVKKIDLARLNPEDMEIGLYICKCGGPQSEEMYLVRLVPPDPSDSFRSIFVLEYADSSSYSRNTGDWFMSHNRRDWGNADGDSIQPGDWYIFGPLPDFEENLLWGESA